MKTLKELNYPKEVIGEVKRKVLTHGGILFPLTVNSFKWHKTKEGDIFWGRVLIEKDFDLFYKHFVQYTNTVK